MACGLGTCQAIGQFSQEVANLEVHRLERHLIALIIDRCLVPRKECESNDSSGSGSGEGKETGGPTQRSENLGQDKPLPKKSTATTRQTAVVDRLVVTIQPAVDYPKTFRFAGEAEGVELNAATKKLDALKAAAGDKLQILEIRVYKNSSEVGTRDVTAFIEHANQIGIQHRVDKIDRRLD